MVQWNTKSVFKRTEVRVITLNGDCSSRYQEIGKLKKGSHNRETIGVKEHDMGKIRTVRVN